MEDLLIYNEINAEINEMNDVLFAVRRRYIRNTENPLEFYNQRQFSLRYRFTKNVVIQIILPIQRQLELPSRRGLPIPPVLCLLITLRYYATGSFQVINIYLVAFLLHY